MEKKISIAGFLKKLEEDGIIVRLLNENLKINSKNIKLSSEILNEIRNRKSEIIKFLLDIENESSYSGIQITEKMEYYPLSSAQWRMYLLQQLDLESTSYNNGTGFIKLPNDLSKEKVISLLQYLIKRHESFRTSFTFENGIPIQKIHDNAEIEITEIINCEEKIEKLQHDFVKPFDLKKVPLMRALFIKRKDLSTFLYVDMHHIISDAATRTIVKKEFMQLYLGQTLKPIRLQYKDYSNWQNDIKQKKKIESQKTYWLEQFSDELPILNLPIDFPRPDEQSFDGASVKINLTKKETEALKVFSKSNDYTLFMSILSVFKILLWKLSGQHDIIVGIPVSGRNHVDLKNIVGMIVNTLPIRSSINGEVILKTYLDLVKNKSLEAFDNQNYQFDELVESIKYQRDIRRNPVFDVAFSFVDASTSNVEVSKTEDMAGEQNVETSKFDLLLTAVDLGDNLQFKLEYCTKLFKPETINRFVGFFKHLIDSLKDNLDRSLKDINILSEKEKFQILYDFNQIETNYQNNKCIHELFEEQVIRRPQNIAVTFNDEIINYYDLNNKANQLGRILRQKGIKPDDIIAMVLNRSIDMIVCILAILKSGGSYLPIDPEYPEDRKKHMLDDSKSTLIITQKSQIEKILSPIEKIDIQNKEFYSSEVDNLSKVNKPNDLAYIIYTSGSTGIPKGVMLEHENVVRLMINDKQLFDFTEDDVWTMFHSYCFDFSVWEMYGALLFGSRMVIIPALIARDTKKFIELLNREQVTILNQTPSAFYSLIAESDYEKPNLFLKYVIFGGEKLIPSKLKTWQEIYPNTKLINMYGITETTVHVTYKELKKEDVSVSISNIGQPIPTTTTYIMDKYSHLQPVGVIGEICVGGKGLGRGYIGNEQQNRERFISNPFFEGERLYKSGDLGRYLENGDIEYLNRSDNQEQIRGYRIELGEIEHAILNYQYIKECVVLAREENDEKYICAYVVCKDEYNQENLRNYLSEHLPDYMIPSYIVELEKIPLTTNGKVNRKALPSPEIKAGDDYVAPTTEIEEKLVAIWSDLLNIPQKEISITANFFAIGGHSLKAAVLVGKIHKELDVELPLRDVFIHTTIKAQSVQIEESDKKDFISIPKAKNRDFYSLSSAQKRLYLLQQMDLDATTYNMPYIIPLGMEADKTKIKEVFRKLIMRHESFRTSFEVKEAELIQRIEEQLDFNLEESVIEKSEVEKKRTQFIRAFDLSQAPLVRVLLVEIKGEGYLLMIDMHHIISDGVSQTILEQEFQVLYSGEELPALSLQYKDYSEWQNSEEQQARVKEQEDFWIKKFEGEIPVLDLAIDYVRPIIQSHEGARVSFALSKEETNNIRALSESNGTTLYMSILSIFTILLSKLSGQEDIIIGSPIEGRRHIDLEQIVGMFVNTLAIRNEVKGEDTLREFIKKLKQSTIDAFDNQEYQFEELVEKVSIEREISRNPLFDVMFNLVNYREHSDDLEGFSSEELIHSPVISKFDLTLTAVDCGEQLMFSFSYCRKLFKSETIERYIKYIKRIVNQIPEQIEREISEIEIISQEEKQQLLYEFNDTRKDYPWNKTIHQLFEEQAEKTPDNIALKYEGYSMTYLELNEESNKLAWSLIDKGVQSKNIIGLHIDHSFEVIIGILGILKAEGCYLPIDKSYQKERISYIIKDCSFDFILVDSIDSVDFLKTKGLNILNIKDENSYSKKVINPQKKSSPNDLAYIIYTSGSTGNPKGVPISHNSVVNYITWASKAYSKGNKLNFPLYSSISFDLTVTSIFTPLLNGAIIRIYSTEDSASIIYKIIKDKDMELIKLTPAHLELLANEDLSGSKVKSFIVGGEELYTSLASKIDLQINIFNEYGPTESTVGCMIYKYDSTKDKRKSVPIGKGMDNHKIFILDKFQNLVPLNVSGELCISGEGLAVGYINNPELTSEKFIDHPFKEGERLYRTGDLARWLPNGNMEFLGRLDHQVKIRGFRIELGEIENTLLKHENVKESVVLAKEYDGDKYLCAYVVLRQGQNTEDLRSYLAGLLPDYMVPSYFVLLDQLPLTPNGKVNRKVLPSPEVKAGDDYIAPSNETEKKLVAIWSEVLKIPEEEISVTANFFAIGGHSLKAMIISSRIEKEFNIKIQLITFFNKPTIRDLERNILITNLSENRLSKKTKNKITI
ncbi:MAG: amino acid adenylation domain-containing protein [Bacteroidales bacterium]|nr:amino acid adenylation domain-containing protein [Bacteroidales bacterium]